MARTAPTTTSPTRRPACRTSAAGGRAPRRGFTLVEAVMAIAITSVLMAGLTSSLMLAGRAVPTANSAAATTANASQVIGNLTWELQCALNVTELTSNAVTFTVADRNNDGQPETIRYAWTATPGDPLTRQYNGGAAVPVVANVQALSFSHLTTSTTVSANVESAEQLFASYDGTGGTLANYALNTNIYVGEYFKPTLPAAATSWKLTRVMLQTKANGATTGQNVLQVQSDNAGVPSGTVLDSASMPESAMPAAYAWQTFTFSNVSGISPTAALHVVAKFQANGPSGFVNYATSASPANLSMEKTTNGGSSWTVPTANSLLIYVYGTYVAPVATTTYTLRSVGVALALGTSGSVPINTSVETLNHPAVSGP